MPLLAHDLPPAVRAVLAAGAVIPAHPLALTVERQVRRATPARPHPILSRCRRGRPCGRRAHDTIRHPRGGLVRAARSRLRAKPLPKWANRPIAMIAGVTGKTDQAMGEADIAVGLGYHAGLLSLAAMSRRERGRVDCTLRAVAARIPLFGFYLQPAVGGIVLSAQFWRRFATLDNVIGIKIAPFNRYRTRDVIARRRRGGRAGSDRALYRQRRPHRARSDDAHMS